MRRRGSAWRLYADRNCRKRNSEVPRTGKVAFPLGADGLANQRGGDGVDDVAASAAVGNGGGCPPRTDKPPAGVGKGRWRYRVSCWRCRPPRSRRGATSWTALLESGNLALAASGPSFGAVGRSGGLALRRDGKPHAPCVIRGIRAVGAPWQD